MKNTYSLRKHLIAWISIPILLTVLLSVAISYFASKHEIEEVYDAQLVHSAKVLLQLTKHEIMEDEDFDLGIENAKLQHKYERKLGFRIWVNNRLISQSTNTLDFDSFEAPPGFSDQKFQNDSWRFFVFLETDQGIKIEVSERYEVRNELIYQLMSSTILPDLVFIPIILLIIWVGVLNVTKPIINISNEVDKRTSSDLTPITSNKVPQEIVPLLKAINRLFTRIEDSFKREREFTDHAAHELRTPLAAMKTQVQVLLMKAQGMSECENGLDNLHNTINRTSHLVEQLLSLARLQNEQHDFEDFDLSEILNGAVSELKKLADSKDIVLEQHIVPDIKRHGHPAAMEVLFKNLIDNAIKYTPKGGLIKVNLEKDGSFSVSDTGYGLNDEEKNKVLQRFVRADKSGQSGSGLGLSIVDWIAQMHNLKLTLKDNKPSGLIVSLS